MKHISIEGMDGVGKSTTCKLLAEKLGYTFVEKGLQYLYGSKEEYQRIAKIVNANPDRNFTAWYYGLNNLFTYNQFKDKNIVTDRHIVSNYCWSGTNDNMDIYNLILKKIGKPTLTVILYASPEVIEKRLKTRNIHDRDLSKVKLAEAAYERMIYFCELKKLPYMVIDTGKLSPEEIVSLIIERIGD